jgi:hypothetical protein
VGACRRRWSPARGGSGGRGGAGAATGDKQYGDRVQPERQPRGEDEAAGRRRGVAACKGGRGTAGHDAGPTGQLVGAQWCRAKMPSGTTMTYTCGVHGPRQGHR